MSRKKPKHSFSKEEKELIRKMKDELRFMGIGLGVHAILAFAC